MGTFHCTQAALPYIPTDGTGRIINVTSAAGLTGTLGQVNYSAAKAGIIGFTKSLARELATKNIMVNALAPLAATPMTETIRTNEKFAANMMDAHPVEALGRTVGDCGCVRVHGVGRGVLHHRTGAAGGRRHGDVMTEGLLFAQAAHRELRRRWPASRSWRWSRRWPPRCAPGCSPTSAHA